MTDELRRHVRDEFNRVSATKVVKAKDFVAAFEAVAKDRLGPIERAIALHRLKSRLEGPLPKAEGIFRAEDAQGNIDTYVASRFMRDKTLSAVERAKGREDLFMRATSSTVDALEKAEDQAAKLKNGQIVPKP